MAKPGIIVLSADTDDKFNWLSDGWNELKRRYTPQARKLMATARSEIDKAKDVPDAIKRLRKAGFRVERQRA
jgi:hypothetical protein